jgi:hypothetical protein
MKESDQIEFIGKEDAFLCPHCFVNGPVVSTICNLYKDKAGNTEVVCATCHKTIAYVELNQG